MYRSTGSYPTYTHSYVFHYFIAISQNRHDGQQQGKGLDGGGSALRRSDTILYTFHQFRHNAQPTPPGPGGALRSGILPTIQPPSQNVQRNATVPPCAWSRFSPHRVGLGRSHPAVGPCFATASPRGTAQPGQRGGTGRRPSNHIRSRHGVDCHHLWNVDRNSGHVCSAPRC